MFEANEATGLAHRHQETVYIRDDLDPGSVVGTGSGRWPDMTDGFLLALECKGIAAGLIASRPHRACYIPAQHVHQALELLYAAAGVDRPADANSRPPGVGHR